MKLFLMSILCVASMMAHAFSRDEAVKIYREKLVDSKDAVAEVGEYLFITVKCETLKVRDGNLKPLILAGQLKAITEYVGRPVAGYQSPFSRTVSERIAPLARFRVRGCKSCVVDETILTGELKNVMAFELAPLKHAQELHRSKTRLKRTLNEWCAQLREYLDSVGSEEDKNDFLGELGCVDYLVNSIGGVIWSRDRVDVAALGKMYSAPLDCSSREKCDKILELNPAEPAAHLAISKIELVNGDVVRAMSRIFRGSVHDAHFTEFTELVDGSAKKCQSAVFREMLDAWRQVVERVEILNQHKNKLWMYAVNTAGHLEFSRCPVGDKRKAEKCLNDAKKLFGQGTDLPKIMNLLRQAIETDPANAESWHYYGAALSAAGKKYDALVALNEAALLDPENNQIAEDLCVLYYALGHKRLSVGNAWRICARAPETSRPSALLDILSKEFSDVLLNEN